MVLVLVLVLVGRCPPVHPQRLVRFVHVLGVGRAPLAVLELPLQRDDPAAEPLLERDDRVVVRRVRRVVHVGGAAVSSTPR